MTELITTNNDPMFSDESTFTGVNLSNIPDIIISLPVWLVIGLAFIYCAKFMLLGHRIELYRAGFWALITVTSLLQIFIEIFFTSLYLIYSGFESLDLDENIDVLVQIALYLFSITFSLNIAKITSSLLITTEHVQFLDGYIGATLHGDRQEFLRSYFEERQQMRQRQAPYEAVTIPSLDSLSQSAEEDTEETINEQASVNTSTDLPLIVKNNRKVVINNEKDPNI